MGSETIYQPDDLWTHVDRVRDRNDLDNRSQAIQRIVREHKEARADD